MMTWIWNAAMINSVVNSIGSRKNSEAGLLEVCGGVSRKDWLNEKTLPWSGWHRRRPCCKEIPKKSRLLFLPAFASCWWLHPCWLFCCCCYLFYADIWVPLLLSSSIHWRQAALPDFLGLQRQTGTTEASGLMDQAAHWFTALPLTTQFLLCIMDNNSGFCL